MTIFAKGVQWMNWMDGRINRVSEWIMNRINTTSNEWMDATQKVPALVEMLAQQSVVIDTFKLQFGIQRKKLQ